MEIPHKLLPKAEFIGKEIHVIEADNASLIGMKGNVVDETKSTFTIMANGTKKVLLKSQITFVCRHGNKKVRIDGKVMCMRPHDRLKQ